MTTETQLPIGNYMTDAKGRLVPVGKVQEIDKLRDETVRELVAAARQLSVALSKFKGEAFNTVQTFIELSGEKYGAKMGGEKGNVTLLSFDGKLKVQRSVGEFITFDERLQVAKQLVDQCITGWAEGVNDNLRALVNDAFQVDNQNRVSVSRILGLRRLDITDEKWQQAMRAIGDSMQTVGSKSYIRVYERVGETEQWSAIPLDLAAV